MVGVSAVLARIPVIKFKKGGLSRPSAPSGGGAPAAAAAAAPAPAAGGAPQVQAAAPMSTTAIPDIDLPAKYKRTPLSQEEIDHINGGGIV